MDKFASLKVSPGAWGEYFCFANTSFSNDNIKACLLLLLLFPLPLWSLLASSSLLKFKATNSFPHKIFQESKHGMKVIFHVCKSQRERVTYTVLLYQNNLHSVKSGSENISLSILHVSFRYKHSSRTRSLWLEPCCCLCQMKFYSLCPAETQPPRPLNPQNYNQ